MDGTFGGAMCRCRNLVFSLRSFLDANCDDAVDLLFFGGDSGVSLLRAGAEGWDCGNSSDGVEQLEPLCRKSGRCGSESGGGGDGFERDAGCRICLGEYRRNGGGP